MAADADTTTLRIGLITVPHHFDPRNAQDFVSNFLVAQIFETPYRPPRGGAAPEPMLLAEPLRLDSRPGEPQVYSAPVRSGVTFSDGTPLDAEGVAASLRSSRLFLHEADAEADAGGESGRVVFRLKRPNARFDLVLTQRFASVLREADGELVATGPYRLSPDSRPDRIHLVKNPRYRGTVGIDELLCTVYPPNDDGKPEALVRAIEAGEVDFCNVLSREQVGAVHRVRKWLEPGSSTAILYFNTEREALADPQVRRALALSIDRSEATKVCYPNPMTFTATSLLPPLMGRWQDGLAPDAMAAGRLLRTAAGTKPERLTLLLTWGPRPYLPDPRGVAELLARQIGALGIEVDVVPTGDSEVYYRKIARGEYDMALAGWIADTPDPADFLEAVLGPDSIPSPDRPMVVHANLARWRHDEAARALAQFRADASPEARDRLKDLVSTEVPLLPLMYGPTLYVYTPRLQDFEPSPLGIPLLHEARLE
jgi:ABC-type transport system substrate-binding protein